MNHIYIGLKETTSSWSSIEKIFLPDGSLRQDLSKIGETKNKTRILYTLHFETTLSITIFNDS
jgi:hypothetical protein